MAQAKMGMTRRRFLKGVAAGGLAAGGLAAGGLPLFIPASALGRAGRPAPSDRIVTGCIGIGGQGSGDMGGFMGHSQVQVVAVCDVVKSKREAAKARVDKKYSGDYCAAVNDFRQVTRRQDIDAVMIATPDHWHAQIAIDAIRHGKDVYCEKPESLTVREGRRMVQIARRYGRVFSGGSQRVWGDYNELHRWTRSGAIGEVKEVYVNVGGPPNECNLPAVPVPEGLDWDMWLGPAPWAAFNPGRLNFRPWRDYSGNGMTDWGAHGFGGAMFACNVHHTGPTEIIPPDGKDVQHLTFVFANGLRMYHSGKYGHILHFIGTKREVPSGQGRQRDRERESPPPIHIPNYKGSGGIIGDFLHCVRTRELPFRDIEVGHRTVTLCHLGNIAYYIKRPIRWDPATEEIVGDPEASRLLDRPRREPWVL